MMKKKVAAVLGMSAVMAASVLAVSFSPLTAKAAVKEVSISDSIDNVYWSKQGSEDVYSLNTKQAVYKNNAGFTYVSTCDTVKGDKDVYAEFNLVSFTYGNGTQFMFQPYSESMDGLTDIFYTTGERSCAQHTSTGNYNDWTGGYAYGSDWGARMAAAGNGGWERGEKYVTKVRYVGRTDGSVSFYLWEQDEANRLDVYAWREYYRTYAADETNKNYFAAPQADKDYHIMFAVNGGVEISEFEFGTLEESAEDLEAHLLTDKSTLTKLVGTKDVKDGTVQTASKNETGKIYATQGKILSYGETVVENPTKNDMLVTTMEVYKDAIATKVFKFETVMQIPVLASGRKVGVGVVQMGADEINVNAVDAVGSSYFYYEMRENKNYLGLMNGGVFVKEYEVGNLSETFAFKIAANKDGTAVVTVGVQEYEFENVAVEGYIAISSIGEGNVKYLIDQSVNVVRYGYTSSEGAAMECNFDEWMDPQKFFIDTHNTAGFANPEEAIGVEQSDGTVFFNGSGSNAVFSPIGMYADFVFEFDYTSFAIEERPAKAAGWMFGYSDLTIAFGNETPYGWGKGAYQLFIRDYSTRQWNSADEPYQGYGSIKLANWMDGGKTIGEEITISDGADVVDEATGNHTYTSTAKEGYLSLYNATTKLKLVVADNVATLYGCTLIEGKALSEYTAEDYIKLGEWRLPEALEGRVSICADENAYFKIDNVRITPLDGKTEGDVAVNLAAYTDFKTIASDQRPALLPAPELKLNGNVVSWAAVDGASGYEVSVNGGENIAVSGTSYTIEATENGIYEIAVKAIGDGGKKLDSNYAKITYTIGGSSTDSTSGNSSSGGSSSGGSAVSGCGSSVGGVSLLAAAVFAVTIAIKKKRN